MLSYKRVQTVVDHWGTEMRKTRVDIPNLWVPGIIQGRSGCLYSKLGELEPHGWRSASYPPMIERNRTRTAKPAGTHQKALLT
jgi:hypothetical protein